MLMSPMNLYSLSWRGNVLESAQPEGCPWKRMAWIPLMRSRSMNLTPGMRLSAPSICPVSASLSSNESEMVWESSMR